MTPISPKSQPPKKAPKRDYRVAAIVAVVVLAAGYGIAHIIGGDTTPRKRVMDTVSLKILPPPPPPKQEPPPPPPPKMVEKQKIDPPADKIEPPKMVDAPPPGPLALDAKGTAGNDAFGLGGKLGGADYTGDGNGTRFGHYGTLLQSQISKLLRSDERLKDAKFHGVVRLKLNAAGGVAGVEILDGGTGDSSLDQHIRQVIESMPGLPEAPPADFPKVVLRINSAGSDS